MVEILECTHLFFEALGNPLRLRIVTLLLEKPHTVSEICRILNVEQSRVSHALTALVQCNVVTYEKDGKKRFYRIDQPFVKKIIETVVAYEKKICPVCRRIEKVKRK
ncbi:ArsR family transcriptional regulator [Candidatus Woesearchaeota archaeon]|nr:MAG: ArsR family transcriptional regulator [Candidatus Woesearchaeota archaeon]